MDHHLVKSISTILQAFGPIIPIMKFSSDEEVIVLANDSNYGLGCAVFSGSQHRAKLIASQLHCGVAAINDFASNYMCQVISLYHGYYLVIHMYSLLLTSYFSRVIEGRGQFIHMVKNQENGVRSLSSMRELTSSISQTLGLGEATYIS